MNKKTKLVSALIVSVICAPIHATNKNPATVDYVQSLIAAIPIVPTYTVGQHAMGGIVFYVDATGTHGLVAANNQYTTGQTWDGGLNGSAYGDVQTNATASGVGAGFMNTSLSVSIQSAVAAISSLALQSMAAQYCVNFSVKEDGITACDDPGASGESCYANWYLPSLYELNQMYLQNSILNIYPNVADNAFFWSSTEADRNNAWRINFSDGTAGPVEKIDQSGAWCIHSF